MIIWNLIVRRYLIRILSIKNLQQIMVQTMILQEKNQLEIESSNKKK